MAACSVWLMLRPGPPVRWPNRATFKRIVAMFVMLLAYALVFQWLGFMLATALLTIGIGRLFGGSWKLCVAGGVGMGISFYVLFDRLLDVVLPVGTLFK
jgi:putative tricarboxylic transport membrane protein